jgi:DNA helicase-2/ATP-dependent DNA helicase PcrA
MPKNSLDELNVQQKASVLHIKGSLRIIAGAGSGKTRVLTHKIAYLISKIGINPQKILAVTFTNKDANEMKTRVEKLLDKNVGYLQISTYHSLAAKILRKEISFFDYPSNFNIMDNLDQVQLLRLGYRKHDVKSRVLSYNSMIDYISKAKNSLMSPEEMIEKAHTDGERIQAKIYKGYIENQKKAKSLDFDDLLLFVDKLFLENKEARDR